MHAVIVIMISDMALAASYTLAPLEGVEPSHTVPKTAALSIELKRHEAGCSAQ